VLIVVGAVIRKPNIAIFWLKLIRHSYLRLVSGKIVGISVNQYELISLSSCPHDGIGQFNVMFFAELDGYYPNLCVYRHVIGRLSKRPSDHFSFWRCANNDFHPGNDANGFVVISSNSV
jgi:hypothetical protein